MEIIIGLTIIAIGSFGQSSSYVPIKKIKNWSWESFWIIQGIFAWVVFPLMGALLTIPAEYSLFELLAVGGIDTFKVIGYGIFWGIGGLTFGLSMRYLGVALGQSLSLGTCSAFGTLIPAIIKGDDLFSGSGLVLLIGVSIAIAGIAIIGYAGSLKSQQMTENERKKAVQDFALKKGILIALLAGVMSACFNLGLEAGASIKLAALAAGASDLFALNPIIFLVTIGGFITNACFCLFRNYKNKTFSDYKSSSSVWLNNILFCALAGLLWYSQFFGLGVGQSFLTNNPIMLAFSWSILMSLNVLFSNIWGIVLKEWIGVSRSTIFVLLIGLLVLVISIIFPQLF